MFKTAVFAVGLGFRYDTPNRWINWICWPLWQTRRCKFSSTKKGLLESMKPRYRYILGVLPKEKANNAHGSETMTSAFSARVMTEVRLGVEMVPSNKKKKNFQDVFTVVYRIFSSTRNENIQHWNVSTVGIL